MSPTAQTGVVDVADLDRQNGATLGRILGRGSVGQAEEGSDGKMRATVRIPEDELVFEPGIIVLPHGGELELTRNPSAIRPTMRVTGAKAHSCPRLVNARSSRSACQPPVEPMTAARMRAKLTRDHPPGRPPDGRLG